MKIGTVLRNKRQPSVTALVVREPYNKPVWGRSGHPEDIMIATFVEIKRTDGCRQILRLKAIKRNYAVVSIPKS